MLLRRLLNTRDGRKIEIKKAEREDIRGIIDVFDDVMREEVYLLGEKYLADEDFLGMRLIDEENELFLVAKDNNKVIGVLTLTRERFKKNRHVAQLGIAIRKGYRSMGIGTNLMDLSFQWAREKGIEKICLEVFSTNTVAINLYRKMGFYEECVRKKQFKIRGEYVDDIMMAKFLNE